MRLRKELESLIHALGSLLKAMLGGWVRYIVARCREVKEVRQRREEYAHEMRRRHVPRVLLSDGIEPEAQLMTTRKADGALTGTPASSGSVTGRARVIMDPVGAHLEPGEILIAPSTDPGWTPLFLTAGGLVMEMGRANSHGANGVITTAVVPAGAVSLHRPEIATTS